MIESSDFDELVFSCKELLINSPAVIVGELAEAIHASSSYAAMTAMALYSAADMISLDTSCVDKLIQQADESCSTIKVGDYKRIFISMQNFERNSSSLTLDKTRFFVPLPHILQ